MKHRLSRRLTAEGIWCDGHRSVKKCHPRVPKRRRGGLGILGARPDSLEVAADMGNGAKSSDGQSKPDADLSKGSGQKEKEGANEEN